MLVDLVEIVLAFVQYITLIIQTEGVNFPSRWESSGTGMSIVNLDMEFFETYASNLIPSDPRVYFMLISNLIPLLLVFIGLFALNSKKVVLWFFILLSGIALVMIGVLNSIIGQFTVYDMDSTASERILLGGFVIILFCTICFVIQRKCCSEDDDEIGGMSAKEKLEEAAKHCDPVAFVQLFAQLVILTVLGLFLVLPYLVESYVPGVRIPHSLVGVARIVGYVILGMGCFTFFWMMMGLCLCGRRAQQSITALMTAVFMKFLLVAISMLLIPVGQQAVVMFNCNDIDCPDGFRHIDYGSHVLHNTTVHPFCTPCVFNLTNQATCPSSVALSLCKASTQYRVENDFARSCNEIQTFFWPAAGLVILMYIIGAPFMFWALIKQSSERTWNEFPVRPGASDEEELWSRKVLSTNSVSLFLYQSFEYNYRYARLWSMFQKAVVVFAGTYVLRLGSLPPTIVALFLATGIHVVHLLLMVATRPFIRNLEDSVSLILSALVVATGGIAIAIWYGTVIPELPMFIFLIVDGVAPLLCVIMGVIIEYSTLKRQERARIFREKSRLRIEVERVSVMRDYEESVRRMEAILARRRADERRAFEISRRTIHTFEDEEFLNNRSKALEEFELELDVEKEIQTKLQSELEVLCRQEEEVTLKSSMSEFFDDQQPGVSPETSQNPLSTTASMHGSMRRQRSLDRKSSMNRGGSFGREDSLGNSSRPPRGTLNRLSSNRDLRTSAHLDISGAQRVESPPMSPREAAFSPPRKLSRKQSLLGATKRKSSLTAGHLRGSAASPTFQRHPSELPPPLHQDLSASTNGDPVHPQDVQLQSSLVEEAKAEVARALRTEEQLLTDAQDEVDSKTNAEARTTLNYFLMAAGIIGFIGMAFSLLGLLSPQTNNLLAPCDPPGNLELELVGYDNWTVFTESCCCLPFSNPESEVYAVLEKWICENGRIKERARVRRIANGTGHFINTVSGVLVREICSAAFSGDCSINVTDNGALEIFGNMCLQNSAAVLKLW